MTEAPQPDGRRTVILDIPLSDAPRTRTVPGASRPVTRTPDVRVDDPGPSGRPAVRPPEYPSVPSDQPVRYSRPAPLDPAPVPDVPVRTSEPDENAYGEWHVVRRPAPARPVRTRAPAQTGRGPLVAVAVAIPAAGLAGILAGVVDAFAGAVAAAFPITILLGATTAWLFLSRSGAWVRARIAALARLCRR